MERALSILFVCTLLLFVIRLWLAGFSGIHPDEAYYWAWAQNLKLGYFDHPPMLAWVIALSEKASSFFLTTNANDSTQQISFRAIPYFLTSFGAPMFLGAFVKRIQRHDLTFTQIALILSSPLFLIGPQIITPDAPLFFGWAWCLYLYGKIYANRSRFSMPGDTTPFSLKLSICFGIALAFCAYSKYTAILIFFLAVITGIGLMNALVAGLVALILMVPYLHWTLTEAREIGAGVFFQMQNATRSHNVPANWKQVGDLVGAQVLFWGIPSFLTLTYIAIRYPFKNIRLLVWSIGPILFFSIGALRRPAEANWPLMGAIAAYALLVLRLHRKPILMFWISSLNILIIILALTVFLNGPTVAPLIEDVSPRAAEKLSKPSRVEEFRGWKRFREFLFEVTREDSNPILVDRYQLLSPILFYDSVAPENEKLGKRLKIWQNGGSRRSQFDLESRYVMQSKGPHWILLEDISKSPKNCTLQQSLFREEAPTKSYYVLKCN